MAIASEIWTLIVLRDALAASKSAADVVTNTVLTNPEAAIAFPTGTTPLGMFDVLAARTACGEADFSRVTIFCLDEYIGVTVDDPNSLTRWLREALLTRIGINPDQLHPLPVTAENLDDAAAEFDRAISARGGLDLAVLGLGPNGHIAYNEPGSSADSRTRIVALTSESRNQASAYWEGSLSIPDRAMTTGVGTLLESRQIVLLVTGRAKAEILRRTLQEPMRAEVPASWLRRAGPRLTVIADEAAASELSDKGLTQRRGLKITGVATMTEETEMKPLQPIRRFDVFAETKRLEALAHGEEEDVAKGYGIRIAKIVASRRFGGSAAKKSQHERKDAAGKDATSESRFGGEDGGKFRALDGEIQSDETFDREIVDRMGPEFYEIVFQPAIREALAAGRKYEQIRDTIRKDWKPARR